MQSLVLQHAEARVTVHVHGEITNSGVRDNGESKLWAFGVRVIASSYWAILLHESIRKKLEKKDEQYYSVWINRAVGTSVVKGRSTVITRRYQYCHSESSKIWSLYEFAFRYNDYPSIWNS